MIGTRLTQLCFVWLARLARASLLEVVARRETVEQLADSHVQVVNHLDERSPARTHTHKEYNY